MVTTSDTGETALASPGSYACPAPTTAEQADATAAERELERELREAAGSVPDPELPMITLEELGVLRGLHVLGPGRVEVELTPTYTGCPAIEAMSEDVIRRLRDRGMTQVAVRTVLSPPWSTDAITAEGRRKLADAGIAPPRPRGAGGPVAVELSVRCPHCGSLDTTLLSRFSSTACKALRRCERCREPFDHFKEL